jgi:hypothetical protein
MRLSKEKRDRLILVAVAAVLGCFVLWWSFIREYDKTLRKNREQIAELTANIKQANTWLKRGPSWAEDYKQRLADLQVKEKTMLPEGKEMSFLSEAMERVRQNHPIHFESISPAAYNERMELLPQFPYRKNATLSYRCYGYYHNFGKFLADLENTYPYMQFEVNSIAPQKAAEQRKEGEDDLRFELKVVALLQPPPPK